MPATENSPFWENLPQDFLNKYLIQQIENPCINAQSIFIRALLLDSLFPGEFDALIHDELQYSAAASTLLSAKKQEWFPILRDILLHKMPPPENCLPPEFLFRELSFSLPDLFASISRGLETDFSNFVSPFAARWRAILEEKRTNEIDVLELACGSANDARYFRQYGLAPFLRYTGIDFAPKNISNARRHFPEENFLVADVGSLPFRDKSFDYAFACDLLEHLEEPDFYQTLRETVRVTRNEIWFSFFNLDWISDHEFGFSGGRPLNLLGIPALENFLTENKLPFYFIHVPQEMSLRFSGYSHYNNRTGILIVNPR